MGGEEALQHHARSASFQITSSIHLVGVGEVRCLVFTNSIEKLSGKQKGQRVLHNGVCGVEEQKYEIELLDSNRLQLTTYRPGEAPHPLVFLKSS